MSALSFEVIGIPATQGSKTGYIRGGRAVVVDKDPAKLKPWREAVRSTAVEMSGPDWAPLTGPITVLLAFRMPRPKSAPKRRRTWPTGARSGDIDKLTRSILDSLTDAGIWADDAQVVDLHACKDYAYSTQRPGVDITIQSESPERTTA